MGALSADWCKIWRISELLSVLSRLTDGIINITLRVLLMILCLWHNRRSSRENTITAACRHRHKLAAILLARHSQGVRLLKHDHKKIKYTTDAHPVCDSWLWHNNVGKKTIIHALTLQLISGYKQCHILMLRFCFASMNNSSIAPLFCLVRQDCDPLEHNAWTLS